MVKIREFTESERLMIYKLRKVEHKTLRQIADRFNATAMGILKIVNGIETHGTARNLSRSGRSKCTTDRTNRLVENDQKITAKEVRELIPKKDREISLRMIQNRIKSNKFYNGFAGNRPMISKQNMAKRLTFAKKYLKMPLKFW